MKNIYDIFNHYVDKYTKMPKLYDVFLSHKQSESQDRAKVYKLFLEQNRIHAFYDKDELTDADWTIEKVIELVSRSKSLMFFLTPTILDNPWCQLELLIAIKAKIPIFILSVEPTWPQKHININKLQIPPYLKYAFKTKIIKDHRYNFDTLVKQVVGEIKTNIKKYTENKKTKKQKNRKTEKQQNGKTAKRKNRNKKTKNIKTEKIKQ